MNLSKSFLQSLSKKLKREEKKLLEQKVELEKVDSFSDTTRVLDNTDVDLEADEQSSHEKTETLKSVLERNLNQVRRALNALRSGKYGQCDICGKKIQPERLRVFPIATLCTDCRLKKEEEKNKVYRKKDLLTSR